MTKDVPSRREVSQLMSRTAPGTWAAVKELKLSCNNMGT